MACNQELLVQESTALIISGGDPSRSATRSAHFLLPRAGGDRPPPALPSPRRNAGPVAEEEIQVELKGWPVCSTLWRRWVAKLRQLHERLWREVGILDAIVATTFRLWRDESVLLQAAAFWSSGTSTFVFPWGEATVTLEDVAVLGVLPLLGQPVCSELPDELRRDVDALEAVRSAMNRTKSRKANPTGWAKRFLERPSEVAATGADGGEEQEEAARQLEHGAFLSMWLCIYALPASPSGTIRPLVFPLAARLARGLRVALAPAVLASIYKDLSALKHRIDMGDGNAHHPLAVYAPLHILQLWVWERFPELRPEKGSSPTNINVGGGAPRAARWHNVRNALAPGYILAVFMSPEGFQWRPYGTSSKELQSSMAPCLRPHESVGVGCTEQYRPHRVARQLGFDQDVPGTVTAAAAGATANSNPEAAWAPYEMQEPKDLPFILVPRHDPGVTLEYARWWEPYSSACAADVANAARTKQLIVSADPRNTRITTELHAQEEEDDPQDEIPQLNGSIIERMNPQGAARNASEGADPTQNSEIEKRSVCTNTLYYLRPSGLVKDNAQMSARGTNSEEGIFQPRRGIGTEGMIREASEARQAEKVELEKKIARLKREILELEEAQLRDTTLQS